MTPTWFEHATFWSGVRRATVAPRGLPEAAFWRISWTDASSSLMGGVLLLRPTPVLSSWFFERPVGWTRAHCGIHHPPDKSCLVALGLKLNSLTSVHFEVTQQRKDFMCLRFISGVSGANELSVPNWRPRQILDLISAPPLLGLSWLVSIWV